MRAAVHEKYGSIEVQDVEAPQPAADEVLVRVRASSVNAADWYGFVGRPYFARPLMGLRRPKAPGLGADFAGVVEAVGADVGDFARGDEVYGHQHGAYAEYVVAGRAVERKPANLSFAEAATVPIAGLTALQGLRDHGRVEPGQRVLINGAAGGVGTFAVQIAKALGATVDAVCSTGNVAQALALGADRTFDYTNEDFARSSARYDVLFDNAGNRSWAAMRRVLAPDGVVVLVGGPRGRRLLGPLGHVGRIVVAVKLTRRKAAFFIAKPNRADLAALRDLIEAGQVKPVVESSYELGQLSEALHRLDDGHARGKIAITVA
jgi:NADPH:quinone reductase-like Zn-dependent oxidoreductase